MYFLTYLKVAILVALPIISGLTACARRTTAIRVSENLQPAAKPLNVEESVIGSNRNLQPQGITLLPYSDDFVDEFDVGFQKWIVLFDNIGPDELRVCEMQRNFSLDSETLGAFVPMDNYTKGHSSFLGDAPSFKTKSGRASNLPKSWYLSILSAKGFLPGEKISLRVKTAKSDEYDTISFYPRPILVSDSDERELITAELFASEPTTYIFHCSFNPKNRLIRIHGNSGEERFNELFLQEEVIQLYYYPDILGETGGFAILHFTYEDGSTYDLELPWGQELLPYFLGLK